MLRSEFAETSTAGPAPARALSSSRSSARSILFMTVRAFAYVTLPAMWSASCSEVTSSRTTTLALFTPYRCSISLTCDSVMRVSLACCATVMPPEPDFSTVMLGGSWLRRMPMLPSSEVSTRAWCGWKTSRISSTRSALLATDSILFPRPRPLEAPFMMPGRSSICMRAPLYSIMPGTTVRVVNW